MAACVLIGSGCASYTARVQRPRDEFVRADYGQALESISRIRPRKRDLLVFLLERGTIRHTLGDFSGSNRDFEEAYRLIREHEERPVVSGRDAIEETGALLTNETLLPYEGEGFERILLHAYKAINFLMLGDLEGARVEIRRLDLRHDLEMEASSRRIRAADKRKEEHGFDAGAVSGIEERIVASMGPAARKAAGGRGLYLSGFGVWLSSLIYDLGGEYDSALIDCRRLLSLFPDFAPAGLDAASYGADDIRPSGGYDLRGRGDLVIIFQNGMAPVKEGIAVPVPTRRGWLSAAFPVYRSVPGAFRTAEVRLSGTAAGRTRVLNDVEAQAYRALADRAPAMVVRQLLRLGLKGTALHAASEQAGGWGGLLVSFYSLLSEQADLRSWLTLPRDFQAFRYYPEAGKRKVEITVLDAAGSPAATIEKEVEFAPDRTTVVNIRAIDSGPRRAGAGVSAHWAELPRPPLSRRPRPVLRAEERPGRPAEPEGK